MQPNPFPALLLPPSPYTRFANLVLRARRSASPIQKPVVDKAARRFVRLCRPATALVSQSSPPCAPDGLLAAPEQAAAPLPSQSSPACGPDDLAAGAERAAATTTLLPLLIDRSMLINEDDGGDDEAWHLWGDRSASRSLGSSISSIGSATSPYTQAPSQLPRIRPILSVDTSGRTVRTAPWEGFSQGFHTYKSLTEAVRSENRAAARAVPTWTCLDPCPLRRPADAQTLFDCMVLCSVQEASRSGQPVESVVPAYYFSHYHPRRLPSATLHAAAPRKRGPPHPDVRVEARPDGLSGAPVVFLAHGRVLQASCWPGLQGLPQEGSTLVLRAPGHLVFAALQHAYLSTVGCPAPAAPPAEEDGPSGQQWQQQQDPLLPLASVYHQSGSLFILACEARLPLLQAYLVEKADCLKKESPRACPVCSRGHGVAAQLVSLVSLTALCREEGVLLGERVTSLVSSTFLSFDTGAFCETYEGSCQQGSLAILECLNGTPLEAVDVFIGPGRCGSTPSACGDDARATFLEVWSAANHKNLVGEKLCIKKMIAKTINNMSLSKLLAERLVSPDGANSNLLSACIDSPKVQEVVKKTFWATVDHASLVLEAYGQAEPPPLVLCLPPPSLHAFFSPDALQQQQQQQRWLWVAPSTSRGRLVLGQCGEDASFCDTTATPAPSTLPSKPSPGFLPLGSTSVFDSGSGSATERSCWVSWARASASSGLDAALETSLRQAASRPRGNGSAVRFPVWKPSGADSPGDGAMLFCVISEDPLDRLILSDPVNLSDNGSLDQLGAPWGPRRQPSPSTVCSVWREETDWDGTLLETELESWTLPGLYEDCSSILWAAVCRDRKTVIGWSAVSGDDGVSNTGALFVCADQHSRLFPDYIVRDVFLAAPGVAQLWQGFDDDLLPALIYIDEGGSLCVLDVCNRKLAQNDSSADFCEPAAVSAACIPEQGEWIVLRADLTLAVYRIGVCTGTRRPPVSSLDAQGSSLGKQVYGCLQKLYTVSSLCSLPQAAPRELWVFAQQPGFCPEPEKPLQAPVQGVTVAVCPSTQQLYVVDNAGRVWIMPRATQGTASTKESSKRFFAGDPDVSTMNPAVTDSWNKLMWTLMHREQACMPFRKDSTERA